MPIEALPARSRGRRAVQRYEAAMASAYTGQSWVMRRRRPLVCNRSGCAFGCRPLPWAGAGDAARMAAKPGVRSRWRVVAPCRTQVRRGAARRWCRPSRCCCGRVRLSRKGGGGWEAQAQDAWPAQCISDWLRRRCRWRSAIQLRLGGAYYTCSAQENLNLTGTAAIITSEITQHARNILTREHCSTAATRCSTTTSFAVGIHLAPSTGVLSLFRLHSGRASCSTTTPP